MEEQAASTNGQPDHSGTTSPSDVEIEAKLKAAPDDLWLKLWTVAEELAVNEAPATWAGGKPRESAGRTTFEMPYVIYAVPVIQLIELLYKLGVVVPFDWGKWYERDRYPGGAGLAEAPVAEAVRLATSYVRGDRFSEGALASAIEDGTMAAILTRLRTWWDSPTGDRAATLA
jgi:hypothetical protein